MMRVVQFQRYSSILLPLRLNTKFENTVDLTRVMIPDVEGLTSESK
jgi:hypothetical protein